jgi:hypothetical protein
MITSFARTLLCQLVLPIAAIIQATAQTMPPIGIIDVYGARHVPEGKIRETLQLKEGDPVPIQRGAVEQRFAAIPGISQAHLYAVCCDAGKSILYIGIEESGVRGLTFRDAPSGSSHLPDDVVQTGEALDRALMEAVRRGGADEDQSRGHSLARDPAARAIQEQFIQFAARDGELLANVLRTSSNAAHRARAAEVMAYATNKQAVVNDLVFAMRDPSADVRNNAVRALALIATFAQRHPELHLQVSWMPFIDLLNSPVWTDRNKASFALMQLTETKDPAPLKDLTARALPALVEMARWKSRGHALPSFVMLGRIAGMPDDAVFKAWEEGKQQLVIEAAKNTARQ